MAKMALNPAAPEASAEDRLRQVTDFFRERGTWVTVALALAAVIVLGFRAYQWRRARQTVTASEKLATARSLQELEALAADYARTPAAALATLRIAKIHYNNGNYDAALSVYRDFEARHPNHPLRETAELGRYHCLEARGQTADALAGFASASRLRTDALSGSDGTARRGHPDWRGFPGPTP